MDAHEDGVGVAVGELRALFQRDQAHRSGACSGLDSRSPEEASSREARHRAWRPSLCRTSRWLRYRRPPWPASRMTVRTAPAFLIFCGRRMGSIIFTTSIAEISVRPSLETIGKAEHVLDAIDIDVAPAVRAFDAAARELRVETALRSWPAYSSCRRSRRPRGGRSAGSRESRRSILPSTQPPTKTKRKLIRTYRTGLQVDCGFRALQVEFTTEAG